MSENTTAEQLVKNVRFTMQRDRVVQTPIDPTLSIQGEAADAKAVGDALDALAAVRKVNNLSPDQSGNVALNASNIPMTAEENAQSVAEAISAAQSMTATEIRRAEDNTQTVEEGLSGIETAITDGCTNDEIDGLFEEEEA